MGPVERVVRPRSSGNATKPKALNALTNRCSWNDAAENNEQRTQRNTRHKPRARLESEVWYCARRPGLHYRLVLRLGVRARPNVEANRQFAAGSLWARMK